MTLAIAAEVAGLLRRTLAFIVALSWPAFSAGTGKHAASRISLSISTEPGHVFDARISRCMMM
jgi:DNA primase